MNRHNFSHLIQTIKVLYVCKNGSLTGLFKPLELYFTQRIDNTSYLDFTSIKYYCSFRQIRIQPRIKSPSYLLPQLFSHIFSQKHGQSLDISLSDRQVSNESKVENTYNVAGCDRNHGLFSSLCLFHCST